MRQAWSTMRSACGILLSQVTRFATRRRRGILLYFPKQVYTRNASIARQPEEHGRRRAKVHVKSWGSLIDTLTDHRQIDITGKQLQINLLVQRFLALLVEVLPHQTHVCERAYESGRRTLDSRPTSRLSSIGTRMIRIGRITRKYAMCDASVRAFKTFCRQRIVRVHAAAVRKRAILLRWKNLPWPWPRNCAQEFLSNDRHEGY